MLKLENGKVLYNNNEVTDPELLYLHLKDLAEEGSFELKKHNESRICRKQTDNR